MIRLELTSGSRATSPSTSCHQVTPLHSVVGRATTILLVPNSSLFTELEISSSVSQNVLPFPKSATSIHSTVQYPRSLTSIVILLSYLYQVFQFAFSIHTFQLKISKKLSLIESFTPYVHVTCEHIKPGQWRTEGGLGCSFNPPSPPPRNSEDIGGVLDRISKKYRRLGFCSSLCSHTVVIY